MKLSNRAMSKNLQKHWGFRKCAGLRRVVSLSSMRARAWKTTKVPSATRRTRCNRGLSATQCSSPVRSPNETLRTALCSPAIDPDLRVETSQLQHAFECRTTLRTDARSMPTRPMHRPIHSSRQWANSGPHNASATMALASPKRWVLPQKPPRSWAAGTAARLVTVCLFCPTPNSLAKGLHYDHPSIAD
jgi:hypothetical protein